MRLLGNWNINHLNTWIAKEEREEEEARLEEERKNYELTEEDIADIRYNEERDERMLYD